MGLIVPAWLEFILDISPGALWTQFELVSSDIKEGLAPGLQHASNEPWPGSLLSCLWEGGSACYHVTLSSNQSLISSGWSGADCPARCCCYRDGLQRCLMQPDSCWLRPSLPLCLSLPVGPPLSDSDWNISVFPYETKILGGMCVVTFIYGCTYIVYEERRFWCQISLEIP